MTDYGLLAYNELAEIKRDNYKTSFAENFESFSGNILSNSLLNIASIKTNKQEQIKFLFNAKQECVLEVYINQKLSHVCSVNYNANFALYLSNESVVSIKIITIDSVSINYNISIIGCFEDCKPIVINIYKGNSKFFGVVKINGFTKIIETTSITELISKINNFDGDTLFGNFVSAVVYLDSIYCLYNSNDLDGYFKYGNVLKPLNKKISNNSILIYNANNANFPLTIIQNNNGILSATELSFYGVIGNTKNINLFNNISIKNICQISNGAGTFLNNNYFIIIDNNNCTYLVLCNFNNISDLSNKINFYPIGIKAQNAFGFVQNSNQFSVNLINNLGLTEVIFELLDNKTIPKKVSVKNFENLTNKYYINPNQNILNFKGYVVLNDSN